jgi:short-subunit dehydrogenase involved in D-alanine esterification of teichoic acids
LKLERKKILFTGGGSGIALELARRHAEVNRSTSPAATRQSSKEPRAEAPSCS